MKKTVSINLGGSPFIIDEDAFTRLKNYLSEIEIRLDGDDSEAMEDIETRIADIFTENISTRTQVVSMTLVNRAISIIGQANEFGEPRRTAQTQCQSDSPQRLYRSRNEKVFGGVCGGLADYFNIDLTLVRVLTFLMVFLGGLSLWVYIILWIAIPLEPREDECLKSNTKKRRN